MSINCPAITKTLEEDRISCLCEEKVGNPPSNLSWYKDGIKVGKTGYKENRLVQNNLRKEDSGTYKCVAQSDRLMDERSFQLSVLCKYKLQG